MRLNTPFLTDLCPLVLMSFTMIRDFRNELDVRVSLHLQKGCPGTAVRLPLASLQLNLLHHQGASVKTKKPTLDITVK